MTDYALCVDETAMLGGPIDEVVISLATKVAKQKISVYIWAGFESEIEAQEWGDKFLLEQFYIVKFHVLTAEEKEFGYGYDIDS